MICQNCGKQISEKASFCSYCGMKVTVPNSVPSAETSTDPRDKAKNPVKKRSIKKVLFIIIMLLILIVVSVLIIVSIIAPDNILTSTIQNVFFSIAG